jgi:hypothetical protein
VARVRRERRVALVVVGPLQHRLRQRQRAPARPRRIVEAERGAKCRPHRRRQQVPGDAGIVGRIARAASRPVDHCAERTIGEQQVARGDVAVDPHRRAVVGCDRPRRLPALRQRRDIGQAQRVQLRQRRLHVGIALGDGAASRRRVIDRQPM